MSVSRAATSRLRAVPAGPTRSLSRLKASVDLESAGRRMIESIGELLPICRASPEG